MITSMDLSQPQIPWFLNFSTADILGQIILCCRGLTFAVGGIIGYLAVFLTSTH